MRVFFLETLKGKKVFVNEGGKNIEVIVKSAKYFAVKLSGVYTIMVKYVCEHNGKEIAIERKMEDNPFFSTKENLLNYHYHDMDGMRGSVFALNIPKRITDSPEVGMFTEGWVIEDGMPKFKANIEVDTYFFDYTKDDRHGVATTKYDCIYSSREECEAYNKIVVTNIEGKEELVGNSGYMLEMTTYTEEQVKALKSLQNALDKMSKVGLTMLSGNEGELAFVNTQGLNVRQVTDADWGCYEENCREIAIVWSNKIATIKGASNNYGETPVILVKD